MARDIRTIRVTPGPVRPGRGAFTLVELVIVIGIITLIACLAVPTIARMFTAGADAQAYNLLAAQLAAARAQAIRTSNPVAVHVQMANTVTNPKMVDDCYAAVFAYDKNTGKFIQDKSFTPEPIPGSMAFGKLTDAYVDAAGNYINLGDAGFTTFTIVFAPSGAVVNQVMGGKVKIQTIDPDTGQPTPLFVKLWDPALAADEYGVTAVTLFDYAKFNKLDWNGDGTVDAADRAIYLNNAGQFLTMNLYTGQLDRRR